jgi:DnaJ-class molecular chaperone
MSNHTYREQREGSGKGEVTCDACNGSGFTAATQPTKPGLRIYPARCAKCGGKGKISKVS